jgi:hypothetical protein
MVRSEQNVLFIPSKVFCNTISHFRQIRKIRVKQYPRCAIKLRHYTDLSVDEEVAGTWP